MQRTCAAAAIGFCIFATGGANAQAPATETDADEARAVELFQSGERAYFAGDYEQAIFYLEQAVELKSNPVLLYNLARSYERADRLDEAIKTYRGYLDSNPEAADRGTIEARIASLEREQLERAASEARTSGEPPSAPAEVTPASAAEPEPRVAADPRPAARGAGALPWVVVGVGALGVGAGAGLWVVATSAHDKAEAEPRQGRAYELEQQAQDLAMAGNVTVAAGSVVLVAGLLWALLDVTEDDGRERAGGLRLRASGRSLGIEAASW